MKKLLALQAFVIASLMQSPAIAQTYSSFFEDSSSSFAALEDSFAPSGNGGVGDFVNGYRDARSSYIDAIKTINYSGREGKKTCSEIESKYFSKCFDHPEFKMGVSAFLNKQKPNY